MKKNTVRAILDAALTIMIVVEMFIQFTGVLLHEIIGFVFFACVATHLGLAAKWISATATQASERTLSRRRKSLAVMGILLALTMVVLGVSSVAISTIIASTGFVWPFGTYELWSVLHAVSSYGLCALTIVHLAMHWAFVAQAVKIPYDPSRRRAIGAGVNAMATVGAVAVGMASARVLLPRAAEMANAQTAESGAAAGTDPGSVVPDVSDQATDVPMQAEQYGRGRGKRARMRNKMQDTAPDAAQNQDATQEPYPSQDQGGTYQEPSEPSYGTDGSNDTGSTDTSGICTLCRKYCPLSAPQCGRPYQQGII